MLPRYTAIAALCLLAFSACSGMVGPVGPDVVRGPAEEVPAPEWRPGDRWVFGWTSGKESGSRSLEVRELSTVNGVEYYILNVGGGISHYYTRQLHFAAAVQAGKVIARMLPPTPWFVWPLKSGARWTHKGTYEEPTGPQPQNDTFATTGFEDVSVPAGRYRAIKVSRSTDRRDSDEYWYAPDVRYYVRWVGRRGEVTFEEQLTGYHPATQAAPSQPSTR